MFFSHFQLQRCVFRRDQLFLAQFAPSFPRPENSNGSALEFYYEFMRTLFDRAQKYMIEPTFFLEVDPTDGLAIVTVSHKVTTVNGKDCVSNGLHKGLFSSQENA